MAVVPNDLLPDQARSLLNLPDVGQVGYVVEDVYGAIHEWWLSHQRVPWLVLDHDHPRITAGKPGRCTLRIALAYEGRLQIELIQVLAGETIHAGAASGFGRQPHHFGFMVNDLEKRLEYCLGRGTSLLQRGTIRTAGIKVDYAYLDASAAVASGVILELIQWRLGPMPMPANRRVFSLTTALGSWNIFRGHIVR
jgi:hypothetical protein